MSDIKLSVVIPVFNNSDCLENLFKKFEAQTKFGLGFELIFVDDGSTDGSGEILDELSKKTTFKTRVIHKENGGVSSARNAGIDLADGVFISFVDADDDISFDYFEFFMKSIKRNPQLVVFQSKRVVNDTSRETDNVDEKLRNITKADILSKMINCPTDFGVYNLFVRKDLLENSKIRFAEGYKYYEDYDFLYRVFCYSNKILYTEKQLYFYVLNPNSAMQKFTKDRVNCIELLENLKPIIRGNSPESLYAFETYGINRIWWSIMWQASLAFSLKDAMKLANEYRVKEHLIKLLNHPQAKVRISSLIYCRVSPKAFVCLVKIFGKRRSKIKPITYKEFQEQKI